MVCDASGEVSPPGELLLERELELGAVEALLADVRAGRGGRLLIEGPAGIGKSTLLAAVCLRAERAGLLCLRAAASEVARNVAFGVAADLLAAASHPDARHQTDATTSLEEGVRAILDLSEESGLLLAVDDVQWADAASVRWLELLASRAASSSLAVAVTVRSGEEELEAALSDLLDDRGAVVVRPAPLSERAAAQLLDARVGRALDGELARVCHAETAGNPYLLRSLGDALRQFGLPTGADVAPRIQELGSRVLTRGLMRRLDGLDRAARALVEAVAVVGDMGGPAELAELVGLDPARAADAARRLAYMDLVSSATTVAPAHPLIAAAIRDQIGAERREQLLRMAAERLMAGGQVEQAAARLAELPPRGDGAVCERLAEAADRAAARGAPDVAAQLLRRALREPAPAEQRGALQAALGRALLAFGDPAAADALQRALSDLPAGAERVDVAGLLAVALLYARRTEDAVAVLDAARAELTAAQEALDEELEARVLHLQSFFPAMRGERERRLSRYGERRGASELAYRMRLAELATDSLTSARPAPETVALAERALAGGVLLSSSDRSAHMKAVLALAYAGRPAAARSHLQDAMASDRAAGNRITLGFGLALHGEVRRLEGNMAAAETDIRTGLELMPPRELGPRFMVRGLIESLVEQGLPFAALDELRERELAGELPEIMPTPGLLLARGATHIAAGSVQLGIEDLLRAGEIADRLGLRDPISVPWRLAAAEALHSRGDHESARALTAEQLQLARQVGVAEAVGAALRVKGRLSNGAERVTVMREAVAALEHGFARFELARAEVDLGLALVSQDAPAARAALASGAAMAEQLGAGALARQATEQLIDTGGRPRRASRRGAHALTPAERRVARLAAAGMTNRQVAETLVVTEKTVESHMASAFRKLGIRSRAELTHQLGDSEAPDEPAGQARATAQ
jgi:DNA-binding CsgD family transcriptional regulator